MWQRFTKRAKKVVFFAQEEAQRFGEPYVSTEHILLGLIREQNVAGELLAELGVGEGAIRAEVVRCLPSAMASECQDMTLTPRVKRVIDLAYDEARSLDDKYIGTEHLLLGLIDEPEGSAGRILAELGVKLEDVRREAVALRSESS